MEYREHQGARIPALGFGTYELTGESCVTAVETALEIGYRHIDTAAMYKNEEEVGKAIASSGLKRQDLWITSKVWMEDVEPSALVASAERSLEALDVEFLDLLLIHWPNPDVPLAESLSALEDLRRSRRIRHKGISNFPPSLMEEAIKTNAPILNNQVEYHPFLGQDRLLEIARKNDMLITAYAPLGQGLVFKHDELSEIGKTHGKTAGQVALRWLIQQKNVAAIPRSSSSDHIKGNFEIFDFKLSSEEIERINKLPKDKRQVDPDFAPDWET